MKKHSECGEVLDVMFQVDAIGDGRHSKAAGDAQRQVCGDWRCAMHGQESAGALGEAREAMAMGSGIASINAQSAARSNSPGQSELRASTQPSSLPRWRRIDKHDSAARAIALAALRHTLEWWSGRASNSCSSIGHGHGPCCLTDGREPTRIAPSHYRILSLAALNLALVSCSDALLGRIELQREGPTVWAAPWSQAVKQA